MAKSTKTASEPALGYEAKLWQMADVLPNNMDMPEYKQASLGLVAREWIPGAFELQPTAPRVGCQRSGRDRELAIPLKARGLHGAFDGYVLQFAGFHEAGTCE